MNETSKKTQHQDLENISDGPVNPLVPQPTGGLSTIHTSHWISTHAHLVRKVEDRFLGYDKKIQHLENCLISNGLLQYPLMVESTFLNQTSSAPDGNVPFFVDGTRTLKRAWEELELLKEILQKKGILDVAEDKNPQKLLEVLKKAARNQIPLKLRDTFAGGNLDLIGFFYFFLAVVVFGVLMYLQFSPKYGYTHQELLSPVFLNFSHKQEAISCAPSLTSTTISLNLDEFGHWSSRQDFSALYSIKIIDFMGFSGTVEDLHNSFAQLNKCIDVVNSKVRSATSLLKALLFVGFSNCRATNVTLHFPISWNNIFDSSLGSWAEIDVVVDATHVDYLTSSDENPPSIVILPPSAQFLEFSVHINGTWVDVKGNMDSLAWCLAVNEGVVNPLTSNDSIHFQAPGTDFTYYYYSKTTQPDLTAVQTTAPFGCGMFINGQIQRTNDKIQWLGIPYISQVEHIVKRGENVGPLHSSITIVLKNLLHESPELSLQLSFYGQGLGIVNTNGFSVVFLGKNNNSLSSIPFPTASSVPFALTTPGVFICSHTYLTNSVATIFATTFSNTATFLKGFVIFIGAIGRWFVKP